MKYLVSVVEIDNGKYDAVCIIDNEKDDLPAWIEPIISCNNVIGVKPDFYQVLDEWITDKVKRLEICLSFPKQCK